MKDWIEVEEEANISMDGMFHRYDECKVYCRYAMKASNSRVFDKFWSMGQTGSTMVSVCTIGNTSWAKQQRVNAVSDNHNYITAPLAQRENCAVPNKKHFGPMMYHMSLSKTLIQLYRPSDRAIQLYKPHPVQ